MNNERILAHKMAKKLNVNDLEGVSAAGTTTATTKATYGNGSGYDVEADLIVDM